MCMEEFLSDHIGIDHKLLADTDEVRVPKVVPLGDRHEVDAKARADADEGISLGNRVENVVAGVDEVSVGIRRAAGYSQAELSRLSGVNIRNIQLYEQGVQDINRASAATLASLARPLACMIENLME